MVVRFRDGLGRCLIRSSVDRGLVEEIDLVVEGVPTHFIIYRHGTYVSESRVVYDQERVKDIRHTG